MYAINTENKKQYYKEFIRRKKHKYNDLLQCNHWINAINDKNDKK